MENEAKLYQQIRAGFTSSESCVRLKTLEKKFGIIDSLSPMPSMQPPTSLQPYRLLYWQCCAQPRENHLTMQPLQHQLCSNYNRIRLLAYGSACPMRCIQHVFGYLHTTLHITLGLALGMQKRPLGLTVHKCGIWAFLPIGSGAQLMMLLVCD